MSVPSGGEARARPERLWLFIVGGVLAIVLFAVGYVQWRQFTRDRQLRTQLHDFIDMGYKTCPYKRLSCCD